MLPCRPLGRTGLTAPILGLGVSGPLGASLMSDKAVSRLILEAYDGGARLFDTAPFYGRAEVRLGQALRAVRRADCVLVTKAGTQRRAGALIKDFAPAAIRASLEASLQRLGVDHVDALLLHGPASNDLTDDLKRELDGLKAGGAIGAYGVCGRGPEIIAALDRGFGDIVQAPAFASFEGKAWSEIACAHGAGFFAIEALRSARADVRIPTSGADLWYLARGLRRAGAALSEIGPPAALRRALTQKGVSAVIMTTTRPAHLRANMAVAREIG